MADASPSTTPSPQAQLATLTAEAHRLYAILVPMGGVQVIVPPHELAKHKARYLEVCAQLTAIQDEQKANRAQVNAWVTEAEEALPQMIPMLPKEWQPRIEKLSTMKPGKERDAELKKIINEIVNGEAIKRLGPMGLFVGPMLQSFLRKANKDK